MRDAFGREAAVKVGRKSTGKHPTRKLMGFARRPASRRTEEFVDWAYLARIAPRDSFDHIFRLRKNQEKLIALAKSLLAKGLLNGYKPGQPNPA